MSRCHWQVEAPRPWHAVAPPVRTVSVSFLNDGTAGGGHCHWHVEVINHLEDQVHQVSNETASGIICGAIWGAILGAYHKGSTLPAP